MPPRRSARERPGRAEPAPADAAQAAAGTPRPPPGHTPDRRSPEAAADAACSSCLRGSCRDGGSHGPLRTRLRPLRRRKGDTRYPYGTERCEFCTHRARDRPSVAARLHCTGDSGVGRRNHGPAQGNDERGGGRAADGVPPRALDLWQRQCGAGAAGPRPGVPVGRYRPLRDDWCVQRARSGAHEAGFSTPGAPAPAAGAARGQRLLRPLAFPLSCASIFRRAGCPRSLGPALVAAPGRPCL